MRENSARVRRAIVSVSPPARPFLFCFEKGILRNTAFWCVSSSFRFLSRVGRFWAFFARVCFSLSNTEKKIPLRVCFKENTTRKTKKTHHAKPARLGCAYVGNCGGVRRLTGKRVSTRMTPSQTLVGVGVGVGPQVCEFESAEDVGESLSEFVRDVEQQRRRKTMPRVRPHVPARAWNLSRMSSTKPRTRTGSKRSRQIGVDRELSVLERGDARRSRALQGRETRLTQNHRARLRLARFPVQRRLERERADLRQRLLREEVVDHRDLVRAFRDVRGVRFRKVLGLSRRAPSGAVRPHIA